MERLLGMEKEEGPGLQTALNACNSSSQCRIMVEKSSSQQCLLPLVVEVALWEVL